MYSSKQIKVRCDLQSPDAFFSFLRSALVMRTYHQHPRTGITFTHTVHFFAPNYVFYSMKLRVLNGFYLLTCRFTMQSLLLSKIFLALLLVTTIVADDEWSWGTADRKSENTKSATAGRNRQGRQHSGRLVFEDDDKTDVNPRNPRVDISTRLEGVS